MCRFGHREVEAQPSLKILSAQRVGALPCCFAQPRDIVFGRTFGAFSQADLDEKSCFHELAEQVS